MKTLILFAIVTVCLVGGEALAQWDTPVYLTRDGQFHGRAQFVIDDSLRLHVFDVRNLIPDAPQPTSMFYQRFDSWGNPLSAAVELLPGAGQFRDDYAAGLLIDRQQNLHVVWCRFGAIPTLPRFFYMRMSLTGEVLTPPRNIAPVSRPNYYVQGGISMTETSDGQIWIAAESFVMVVDEQGETVRPMEPIFPTDSWGQFAHIACAPDNHIWACLAYCGPPRFEQNVSVVRLDTLTRVAETVTGPDSGQSVGIGEGPFYIDSNGAFHYILYRDDAGIFYQRDARDGSAPDTSVFDPHPYGSGDTGFALAGDTLEYMWNRAAPPPIGNLRVGYTLDGRRVIGPELSQPPSFGYGGGPCFIWKRGSYWVIGGSQGQIPQRGELTMLHIPSPSEPPDGSPQRRAYASLPMTVTVFPQPVQEQFDVRLPSAMAHPTSVAIYNLLGQKVSTYVLNGGNSPEYRLTFPPALPAGTYFLSIRTASHTLVSPITHIP